ncbi:MAG: DUF6020 family protein [Eubacteriales bacterium]|nr:DUF6020 family protein [Eubacteriales bacterium]
MYLSKKRPFIFLYTVLAYFFLTSRVVKKRLLLFPDPNSYLYSLSSSMDVTFPRIAAILLDGLTFVCVFLFFYMVSKKSAALFSFWEKIWIALISSLFSLISVAGIYFSTGSTIGFFRFQRIHGNWSRSLLVFAGGFFLFSYGFLALDVIRQRTAASQRLFQKGRAKRLEDRVFAFLFRGNLFARALLVLTLLWIPQTLLQFPGAVTVDASNGLLRYYGAIPYTTQHPLILSRILGRCTDVGFALGDPRYGLFLFILLQTAAMLLVLAYTIQVMDQLHIHRWFIALTLGLFCILPVFAGYSSVVVQDTLYCTALLLLVDQLACCLFLPETFRRSPRHLLLTAIGVLGTFFRYNGFFIILAVLFLVTLREIFLLFQKKNRLLPALLVILAIFLPFCAGKANQEYLEKRHHAENVSTRAFLALPLQQTARCLARHGDEISDEVYAGIRAALSWERKEYRRLYDPYRYDRIKRGFQASSPSDIKRFLAAWLQLVRAYPDDCISATLAQNYCLFSPLTYNTRYYRSISKLLLECPTADFSSVSKERSPLHELLNKNLSLYYHYFIYLPVVGLLANQGFYVFLLFALCAYAFFDKDYRYLMLCVPALLTLAITFVGPAAYGCPRYTFPIVYSMSLLFGLFLRRGPAGTHYQEV